MDQLVVLQEIFESYMRGGFSRPIDPKSISGDCANLVAALLESFEDGQIDEKICTRLLNCLSDIYDIKRLGDICRLAGHLGIAARCYNKALTQTTEQHVKSVLYNNLGQVTPARATSAEPSTTMRGLRRAFRLRGMREALPRSWGTWDLPTEAARATMRPSIAAERAWKYSRIWRTSSGSPR